MKTQSRSPLLSLRTLLGAFLLALPLQAATANNLADNFAQTRIKSALNTMVQDVKDAETPEAKRAVLDGFLTRAGRVSTLLQKAPFMDEAQHQAAGSLRARFAGYADELHGTGGRVMMEDGDLNAFASFMQQDIEQANGGIYLSTGAVIIVLLILILVL